MQIQGLLAGFSPFLRQPFDISRGDERPGLGGVRASPFRFRPEEREARQLRGREDDDAALVDKLRPRDVERSDRRDEKRGYDMLGRISKDGMRLVDHMGDELRHDAVKDLRDHLRGLEDMAAEMGVDREDFRNAITAQWEANGVRDDNGNSEIDAAEIEASFSSQRAFAAAATDGAVAFSGSLAQSADFKFKGEFTTEDGRTVSIDALFEYDLSSNVAIAVAGFDPEAAQSDGRGSEERRGREGDRGFDYGDLVGGLIARLNSFRAERREREDDDERRGRIDRPERRDEIERSPRDRDARRVDNSPEQGAGFNLAAISYDSKFEQFYFQGLSMQDSASGKALAAYTSSYQSSHTHFDALLVTA